ncbi:MAG: universal stress protein, partial [Bacteroidetes bacterium]
MKHILFPTDFSDNSEHALPFALELARIYEAELNLFNSYKLPYSKSNLLVSIVDRMKKDSEDGLEKLKQKALSREKYKHIKINLISRSGGFVESIPKVASFTECDLIVMSTKGASGLKEMFIGSNTLEVIHTTDIPVLAIPENAVLKTISKIAYSTDLKKLKHPENLNPMFDLARTLKIPIEFVHIIRQEDEYMPDEVSRKAIELEALAKGIKTSFYFTTNDDIINGISEYINT